MNFNEFKNKYCKYTPVIKTLEPKIQGWNSQSVALKHVIETYKPEHIIEVGSWLGASAIYMSTLTSAPIICVDTFLGSNEILWRENSVTNLVENFDKIYEQFCVNITSLNLNNQISPLPMTSSSASELFIKEQIKVDMVYIDAGHRFREVYADLQDWWPLTNKVLIGDDYNNGWPETIEASNQFAQENNLMLQELDFKYIFIR